MEAGLSQELLDILCCPETHQGLELMSEHTVEKLNQLQSAGKLLHRNGKLVEYPITGGLLREDGNFIYPIREGFPVMLVEEAIPKEMLED